jgi:hypothetical protein
VRLLLFTLALGGCSFSPLAGAPVDDAPPGDDDGPPASDDGSIDADDGPDTCMTKWRKGTVQLTAPVRLANVNSTAEDRDPFISNDERTLVFASRRNGTQNADILVSFRENVGDDFFGAVIVPAPVSSSADDTRLTAEGTGTRGYLATSRSPTEGNSDIFTATRADTNQNFGAFTQTRLMDVNTSGDELDPEISFDDLTLYFATGLGAQQAIVFSRRATTSDNFPAPAPLIDSNAGDADPSLSPDELVILFTSQRPAGGLAGVNIWYATRADKQLPFEDAKLVPGVNSNGNDGDPSLSRDGCRVYFATDNGFGNLELVVSEVMP